MNTFKHSILVCTFVFGIVFSFFAGCANPQSSRARANSPEVIEKARQRVLGQLMALDVHSREMIRTNAPKIWYVGAPFGGEYTYQWIITSNRFAELITYSLEGLGEHPVRIRER